MIVSAQEMDDSTGEVLMRAAIDQAALNPMRPFGTVIAKGATIIAKGINHSHDAPHWHGEIDALDQCSKIFCGNHLVPWNELTLVTTAEPCPMCMSAILWAGLGQLFFGTSIATLTGLGWWQIQLSSLELLEKAPGGTCKIRGGILEKECDVLFQKALKG